MSPEPDTLLEALEAAVLAALSDPSTRGKDRTDAIQAGIRLVAIKHKINGRDDDNDYFGGGG